MRKTRYVPFFMGLYLLVAGLCSTAWAGSEITDVDRQADMLTDIAVVRPVGILALVAGTIVFVVSSPFSALGGNLEEAYEETHGGACPIHLPAAAWAL